MKLIRQLVPFALLSLGVYALVIRPRLLRWGTTDGEASGPYPGADLIPDGTRSATMAITIEASPAQIWPWLVQMGYGRAGWYSWDRLDNWGHRSADRIHPEWQEIAAGDRLPSMPNEQAWWEVAALKPQRFLGLRASFALPFLHPFDPKGVRPRFFTDSLWGFELKELPGSRTRLIVSGYWAFQPRWLQPIAGFLLVEAEHWVMQTRQFARLKWLVEHEATHATPMGT